MQMRLPFVQKIALRRRFPLICLAHLALLPLLTAIDPNAWEEHLLVAKADKGWFSAHEEAEVLDAAGHSRRLANPMAVLGPATLAFTPLANSSRPGVPSESEWPMTGAKEDGDPAIRMRRRCRGTKGDWCGKYDHQITQPFKPAPLGITACKNNCNGVGNCNYDIGICDCPAGWAGDDCATRQLRPCTNLRRSSFSKDPLTPTFHIDAEGRDLDWQASGWTASRCSGICDADLAMCWCDGKNKHLSRIGAPPGSPPGTPPLNRGRPLSEFCGKVKHDREGKPTAWGNVEYERVYGPNGWCEAERNITCDSCMIDGLVGDYCDEVVEMYCPNQCSGHGDCYLGFCKCHAKWYGLDCSRPAAGPSPTELPDALSGRKPWLSASGVGVPPPATTRGAASSHITRKRPFIFVYDVPPAYATRMLQYRLLWKACIWRQFTSANETKLVDWIYGVETYLHEMMLASEHRTFDPEEADFFFVPIYVTCFFWPILGWADFPYWHSPDGGVRPMQGANMMMELLGWMKTKFPYWNRRQGRDHIFLTVADEGACWMPTEIYQNSIILTHWGRTALNHTSQTGFYADDYNNHHGGPLDKFQKTDWHKIMEGHACYTPGKDLVIPSLKPPSHYDRSPLMGAEPLRRDILLFFKGDVGKNRAKIYSRGIRQTLYNLSLENNWREQHRIYIGDNFGGSYSEALARSVFCLVAPGDGWSARAEDSILHGCIPMVVMDGVHTVFESILDWDSFSVRVREDQLAQVPEILKSFTDSQIQKMQRRLFQVWHRFGYQTGKPLRTAAQFSVQTNNISHPYNQSTLPKGFPFQRVTKYPVQDDAFGTIMQWLHSRINATR